MNEITIRAMTLADYEAVLELWQESEGVGLSDSDEREEIAAFLARNPGLSQTAWAGGLLVGAVLCGHDGRRGYIHHLAVAPVGRRQGIGRQLVEHCLARLQVAGIKKCHLFVFHENEAAVAFWEAIGWVQRVELKIMSYRMVADSWS